jgi:hypothetical protein
MELTKIQIPKDRFRRIPKDEQVLFVLLGHLANELNVLGKLMGWCHNAPRASQAEADAHLMQTVFLAKLLAGKLNEGWETFRRGFFGAGLSKEYHPLIEKPQRSDLDQLKRYFDRRDNAVRLVRNLTFHGSLDQIASCLEQSFSFRDELTIFLGREYANSFEVGYGKPPTMREAIEVDPLGLGLERVKVGAEVPADEHPHPARNDAEE